MTQKEKAQRYNEALKKANTAYKDEDRHLKAVLERIFPELKENKMEWIEKIRQELKSYLKHREVKQISESDAVNQWIDWIKKQGKQEEPQVYDTGDGEVITYSETEGYKVVGPKFHEGDWVVFNNHNDSTYQVEKIVHCEYIEYILRHFLGGSMPLSLSYQDMIRTWTIQDAKDGDVLVDKYNNIGIFQECVGICWHSYVYLGCDGELKAFGIGGSHEQTDTHPATKKQRNTLEKAMIDAGYTFDFEKKELKNIETEIEIPFGAKDSELQEAIYHIPKGFHAEINDDKVVIKKGEKPTEWSEEDDKILEDIMSFINHESVIEGLKHRGIDYSLITSERLMKNSIAWLKSLKQRIGG